MGGKTLGVAPYHPRNDIECDPAGGMSITPTEGITLRQHYAGLAMQALIATGMTHGTGRAALRHADELLAALTEEAK